MSEPDYTIIPFPSDSEELMDSAATLLVEAFRDFAPKAWPDKDSAQREIKEMLQPGHIALCAVDKDSNLLGLIGGMPMNPPWVWELHPLAVREAARNHGVGRALVFALEVETARRGAITMFLGTDDETNLTSLSGIDLYQDTFRHLTEIQNLRGHPFEFYEKCGYKITGVLPDANGPGRPDIWMTKRITRLDQ